MGLLSWLCSLLSAEPLGGARPITHQKKKSQSKPHSSTLLLFSSLNLISLMNQMEKREKGRVNWLVLVGLSSLCGAVRPAAALNPQIKDNQTNQPISINAARPVNKGNSITIPILKENCEMNFSLLNGQRPT